MRLIILLVFIVFIVSSVPKRREIIAVKETCEKQGGYVTVTNSFIAYKVDCVIPKQKDR